MISKAIIIWTLIGLFSGIALIYFSRKNHKLERAILSLGLPGAALVYMVFAVISGELEWIGIEALGVFLFAVFYYLGRRVHFVWIGIGWLLHPLWDYILHLIGPGQHVAPSEYAVLCIMFDFVIALYIFSFPERFKKKKMWPEKKTFLHLQEGQ